MARIQLPKVSKAAGPWEGGPSRQHWDSGITRQLEIPCWLPHLGRSLYVLTLRMSSSKACWREGGTSSGSTYRNTCSTWRRAREMKRMISPKRVGIRITTAMVPRLFSSMGRRPMLFMVVSTWDKPSILSSERSCSLECTWTSLASRSSRLKSPTRPSTYVLAPRRKGTNGSRQLSKRSRSGMATPLSCPFSAQKMKGISSLIFNNSNRTIMAA